MAAWPDLNLPILQKTSKIIRDKDYYHVLFGLVDQRSFGSAGSNRGHATPYVELAFSGCQGADLPGNGLTSEAQAPALTFGDAPWLEWFNKILRSDVGWDAWSGRS